MATTTTQATKRAPKPRRVLDGSPDLGSYDHIIVAFSGGKDSLACLLHLIDQGVARERIELWHHDIDGRGEGFMDWPVTPAYCAAVAKAFGVSIFYSWRVGGFLREMLRNGTPTAPVQFDRIDGTVATVGGDGKPGTRLRFPQMSADLQTRWCSAYLKIDVAAAAIVRQDRFEGKRVLMVTGERAEESPGRAKYPTFEHHKTSNSKRTVHAWRPVHAWTTAQVWQIIERHSVNPHPAYRVGFGRCSCAFCIFGKADQWASAAKILPDAFAKIQAYEQQFGTTIRRNKQPILAFAQEGQAYAMSQADMAAAQATTFGEPIIMAKWVRPSGADAELVGPC